MRPLMLPVVLLALLGCAPRETVEETEQTEEAENFAPPSDGTAAFEVHEWGLVRIFPDGAELATSNYNARPAPIYDTLPGDEAAPRKPIVYLHPLEGFDLATSIQVDVGLTDGTLNEVWPSATPGWRGPRYTFGPLTLEADGCDASLAPDVRSAFCQAHAGEVCETAELASYLRPVAHCLSTPDGRAPILLYNGIFNHSVAPVTVVTDRASATTTVTNTSPHPVGPLWVVSIDNNVGAARHYHRVEALAAGERRTFTPADATLHEPDHAALIGELREALLAKGLTENEADDFIDAWRPDVLAPRTGIDPSGPWTVFGFFDDAFIDAQLPMTITPSPRAVHRAIAFSIEVGAR